MRKVLLGHGTQTKVPGTGVAPAMCYRLCGISTYRLNGLKKGDEHPVETRVRSTATLQPTTTLLKH